MLDSAKYVYFAFGDGIKKTYTDTVEPFVFNRLMNVWAMDEWLKDKVSEKAGVQIDEKLINDLQRLIVITDGSMVYNGDIMYPIAPDVVNGYSFSLPDKLVAINNNQATTQIYPKFLRRIGIAFKLNYVNNICHLKGISNEFLKAQIMRAFERNEIYDNVYRCPKDDRLYFDLINDKVVLSTGTASNGNCMRLEYLRYPKSFFFDPNRNIKSLLTILTNSVGAGTMNITVTTTGPGSPFTFGVPMPILLGQSKYIVAQNLFNYIIANVPVLDACSISDNNVGIGQFGYDVLSLVVTLVGAPVTTSQVIGDEVTDVNLELPDQQRKEIVDQAVRIFLERITDIRYKSFFNEQNYRTPGTK